MLSKLNSLLRITCVLFLIAPTTALAYHVPTQAPSNLTLTVDYENGTVKADWDASDQMEDYPAERYAIGFGLSDEVSLPYGIATGNVGDSNALNTEYTFTASYLNAVFNQAHGLFHVAIRSDNDTNASYSEWTSTVSITIQNKPASVTLASYDMNREDGIKFEWSASTSGFVSASTYKMYYKLSNASEWTLEGQQSNTDYVLAWDNLTDDTYDFMLSACGSENDCNDSNTLTVDVVTYVAPTTTTSTTTTTTLPPKVEEVYVEPEPLPPPPEEIIVDIVVEGVDKTYTQADVNDGTIERDQERIDNELEFGCFMTNAQIERGDCIIIIEVYEEEDYEEEYDTEEELFNDVDVVDEVEDEFIEEEFIELTEQEIEELEKQMEFEVKELELKEEVELFEFDSEEEAKEFIETFIEVEEFLEELEEVEVEEIIFEDIPKDIIIEIEDEIIEDELVEEVFTDESEAETEVQEQVVEEEVELTEEELKIEVAELEEVIEEIIVLDIPKVTEEELEEYTEEELIEYEEAKEEAIEEFVEELETEEVVEILEEINDVGVENLAEVSQEVIEVVAQVVEEVITIAQEEVLTEEQTEVVAEVLGFTETEDVQIIAEAVKTDENVAQAVDEFVERAVEFAKNDSDQEFTLADATTEIAFESFVASPVSVIIDIDLDAINLNNIANDMTTDQKEKAQEVIVPTILVRIVSFAMRRFD